MFALRHFKKASKRTTQLKQQEKPESETKGLTTSHSQMTCTCCFTFLESVPCNAHALFVPFLLQNYHWWQLLSAILGKYFLPFSACHFTLLISFKLFSIIPILLALIYSHSLCLLLTLIFTVWLRIVFGCKQQRLYNCSPKGNSCFVLFCLVFPKNKMCRYK